MIAEIPNAENPGCWMLVDDNQDLLVLMEKMITLTFGVEVELFQSPAEALAAFRRATARYHGVITDLEMPGLSGFELCRELQAAQPEIRVLLATGSRRVTVVEARRRGFCGLLEKPFTHAALRRELACLQQPA